MGQTKEGAMKAAARAIGMDEEEFRARVKGGEKRCSKCKTWRPKNEFGSDKSRGDGKDTRCHPCRCKPNPRTTKGRVSTFKGHKHTPEAIEAMRQARLGKPGPRKGMPRSPEIRQKISRSHRENGKTISGARHHAFKDGKAVERHGLRFTLEYKRWRYDVFTRDGFKCQRCGDERGHNLHAHHIKPFAEFPDLRFELSNGLTLCRKCHKAEHQK